MNRQHMKRAFIETNVFTKRWNEHGLSDDDLLNLQTYILKNPSAGDIVQGAGGLTKLRFALPNRGKSGSVRVLYVDFIHQEKTVLVNCYSKSQQDSISDKEKTMYRTLIKSIKEELK